MGSKVFEDHDFVIQHLHNKVGTLTSNNLVDITSWFKTWEAVVAVYYKCIVTGYRGTFRGLGKLPSIEKQRCTMSVGWGITNHKSTGANHDLFINVLGP